MLMLKDTTRMQLRARVMLRLGELNVHDLHDLLRNYTSWMDTDAQQPTGAQSAHSSMSLEKVLASPP